jgi:hypothetical protein
MIFEYLPRRKELNDQPLELEGKGSFILVKECNDSPDGIWSAPQWSLTS